MDRGAGGPGTAVLALLGVHDRLPQPLLVVEELALEVRELLIGAVADAQEDLLKLLEVLDRGSHRECGAGASGPGSTGWRKSS
jgi:hypothetical protein